MSAYDFNINPDRKVWMNGEFVPADRAAISVFDHAVLYGDGVFEGIRAYQGTVFRLEQHIQRFYESARGIRLALPYTPEQTTEAVHDSVRVNGLSDAYIRLVITRGVGYLGLNPFKTVRPVMFIIADQLALYPKELYRDGMPVITASTVRNHPNAVSPRVKSLNYLNNILAQIEAIDAGVHEAIMFNHLGFVAEATGDNVFVVRRGQLHTPPTAAGILEGVTRNFVIELAAKRDIEVIEKDLVRQDLYGADECFLTGTGAEIAPITKIDGRPIGDGTVGTITRQLMDEFAAVTGSPIG